MPTGALAPLAAFLTNKLLAAHPALGRIATIEVAFINEPTWAGAFAPPPSAFDQIKFASHAERWRLGAVVAQKGLGRLLQLPLISSGGFACSYPEEGASLCSLRPQAVVGSRFWLVIAWRCATSPGSGRPVTAIAVRKGEPPYKCCN